jgi:signal transduction histidine kinase
MTEAPKIPVKWRPSLALVVYSVLLVVLALPSGLIILVRALGGRGLSTLESGVLVVSLIVTLVIAYVLTRAVTKPIAALVGRTREISQGGRDAIRPLEAYGTAELATLSQGFLDLASRLMDRTEYMRSFAAHVSHELKSPLTAIKGSAELMRDEGVGMTEAERRRFLDHIVADADRLTRLVARLRELAQAEMPLARGETTLNAVLLDLRSHFSAMQVTGSGEHVVIGIPTEALAIVLSHLAENALEHSSRHLSIAVRPEEACVIMTVADDGSGISEGNRDKIFQPFFTTRRESGGTGMGLDIVRAMLEAHDADIALVPSHRGAMFRLVLPASLVT